jgi:hypothetical protein
MPSVNMPDMGLASGLAEGLKQGLISYQNIKNIQHQQQMQELVAGVQKNPVTGALENSPLRDQQMQAQGLLAQNQIAENDPESDVSQKLASARGLMAASGNAKIPSNIYSGLSASQQKELDPLTKTDLSGQFGILKSMMNPLAEIKREQMYTAKDNQAAQAVDKVTNDPQLKNHAQRIQGADRILGQLGEAKQGKIVDTNQLLNDINTEYVNLLTGANNSALGKQERTEYTTMAGNLAALKQKLSGDPQSINSPEILNQLETQVRSLKSNYQGMYSDRANSLKRNYSHNKDATDQQQAKINEMVGQFGGQPSSGDDQAAKLQRLQELRAKAAGG